ncbi:hypothetical protein [Streptomyces sediminimaris]|uniref:hypothetical protein n=1 Tax=Streptomyces sediminimaris TaxID=3383721 RepID=UPI00399BBCE9
MAGEFKRLVHHSTDPEKLDCDLAGARSLAGDPEKVRATQLGMARLRSPQLVPVKAS